MKRLSLYVFLVLMFCNNAFADIKPIYFGYLKYPDGKEYRMISKFKINDNYSVWGNYEWYEKEKKYEGVFFRGKLEGNVLKIFWTDKFGEGWLKVKFDKEFYSFDGEWGVIKDNFELKKEGDWTGSAVR